MKDLPTGIVDLLGQRRGVISRVLFYITAKNRETGDPEPLGIWNGIDHRDFTIDGETRTYYGAGNLLNLSELTSERGLTIRKLTLSASPLSTEIKTILREYDPKFAPVDIHLAIYNPDTNNMVSDPLRVYKGWLDKLSIKTSAMGGDSVASLELFGNSRILTRMTASKRSDENQRKRLSTDSLFKYISVSGAKITTPWGAK